jgi:hypothetical protein
MLKHLVYVVTIISIVTLGSAVLCGSWPFSSDFVTNYFSVLGCQPYTNARHSWRIDVLLSWFSLLAERPPFQSVGNWLFSFA